ncbi:ATP-grasp domain-containing protein [Micromonospora deserti]|nr:ATP-grasp domain-containing protein [Micromonospora deserti]
MSAEKHKRLQEMTNSGAAEGPLVILGANARVAGAAGRLGCPVAYVQGPDDSRVESAGDTAQYFVDYASPEFLDFVGTTLAQLKPRAVVALSEAGLWPAALANELLGLPGTSPETVVTLCDKVLMRSTLVRNGASDLSVRFAEPSDGRQAAELVSSWPAPLEVILKPRSGTGSRGVELIRSPAQLEQRGDLTAAIVEEYIPGQEYSAETFSVDGSHRLVAVAEKRVAPDSFVELGHVVPAPSLSDQDIAMVEAAVSRFLDAVDLRDGAAHTEFKIDNGSVKIIESHNRMAGDDISVLVRLVTGFDLMQASIGWPVGQGVPPLLPTPVAEAAAIAFAVAPPGLVKSVTLPTEAAPGIRIEEVAGYVGPGDLVRALTSSSDRAGHVIVTGPSAESAMAAAEQLAAQIDVQTMPVP